jgi:anti-sigma regulatory factor (Ser/Thr protein kinase)
MRPIEFELEIEPSPNAPAEARAGISQLQAVLSRHAFSDLQLILSELVTNSARYGPGDPIKVSIRYDGDEVTGGVSDRSGGKVPLPADAATPPGAGSIGNWGLPMVDRLTDGWGLEDRDQTIWFRLAG